MSGMVSSMDISRGIQTLPLYAVDSLDSLHSDLTDSSSDSSADQDDDMLMLVIMAFHLCHNPQYV